MVRIPNAPPAHLLRRNTHNLDVNETGMGKAWAEDAAAQQAETPCSGLSTVAAKQADGTGERVTAPRCVAGNRRGGRQAWRATGVAGNRRGGQQAWRATGVAGDRRGGQQAWRATGVAGDRRSGQQACCCGWRQAAALKATGLLLVSVSFHGPDRLPRSRLPRAAGLLHRFCDDPLHRFCDDPSPHFKRWAGAGCLAVRAQAAAQ